MCGIAGIYKYNTLVNKQELKKMTNSLIHRGPDGEGQWVNRKRNLGLGHRRLSIIDLSDKAAQPMHAFNQRYSITFNGEIYNYLELRTELINKGYTFITNSDTEVLLNAYDAYGEAFLQKLDGMFAFAIWDEKKQELFCARDRFGEKPFYYYKDKQQFVFASEMKAIFSYGIEKTVDQQMIYLYLTYDVVENPNNKKQTFYKNISQLPASHSLTISSDRVVKIKKYWGIDINKKSSLSFKEAQNKFIQLFDESLKRRMRSDVKVGSSLSGGVDSSSILCSVLQLFPNQSFNTFTARFKDKKYDEGVFVDQLKKKCSFNAFNCYPKPDQIISDLDKIFYHQEEPFGTSSIIAQWEVMKTARANNTIVLLDGQGADESLGGYFKYFLPYLYEIKNTQDYKNQKQKIEKHLNIHSFLSKQEEIRMIAPNIFDKLTDWTRPYRVLFSSDLAKDFKNEFKFSPTPFHRDLNLNSFLYNDLFKYGLGKLLRFSDRNAMAHSVEVRLPYLSHQLVEFVFSLPSNYKIENGWTKHILRKSMQKRVPDHILFRKDKKGFQAPNSWLKEPKVMELINSSYSLLKDEKYTKDFVKEKSWNYIMLGKLLIK